MGNHVLGYEVTLHSLSDDAYFANRNTSKIVVKLDGSMPANPVNDLRKANAVTLKSTFCLP